MGICMRGGESERETPCGCAAYMWLRGIVYVVAIVCVVAGERESEREGEGGGEGERERSNPSSKPLVKHSENPSPRTKGVRSIMHRPHEMRGLHLVDDWRSRLVDWFAGLPKCPRGVRQKQVSCAGLHGRVPGLGGAPGGCLS
jgi:hypothetical protein